MSRSRDGGRLDKLARTEALYKISNIVNTTLEPRRVLQLILKEVVRVMRANSGTLILISEKDQRLDIEVGINVDPQRARRLRLRLGEGVTGKVARTGRPLRVDDVRRDSNYVSLKRDVRSELAVPLAIEGKTIGVINVDSTEPGHFTEADKDLMMAVAAQSSKVLHTAQLYEAVRRQTVELESLFNVGQTIISPSPLQDVLQKITEQVTQLMQTRVCSIMLLDADRERLLLKAYSGSAKGYREREGVLVSESLVGEVVGRRRPLAVYDVQREVRFKYKQMARAARLRSLLSVPINYHDRCIGLLNLYTEKPRHFRPEEERLMLAYASQCAIAIVNAQRYERVLLAEDQLRQSEKLSLLGILAAEVAHELRNPITVISMLLGSLKEELGDDSPSQKRDLTVITSKLERMETIVERMLDLARSREMKPEAADVRELVDNTLVLLQHKFSTQNIEVVKRFSKKMPLMQLDRGQMEQVFLNLFLNALQAMPEGGRLSIAGRVRNSRKSGRQVVVEIADTGQGIPKQMRERLFQPFFSTKREGTGLGLFVTQKLLANHHGELKVKSAPGKGTRFTLTLPVGDR
ncbi:MAG: GAF domain-containing protein [bacterium]